MSRTPTIAYCDRLTLRSSIQILLLRRRHRPPSAWRVCLIDEPSSGLPARILTRVLRMAAVDIEYPEFFAGHLRTADRESVPLAASAAANRIAFAAAEDLLRRSRLLSAIDARWHRGIVRLHLAKGLWSPLRLLSLRVFVTLALDGHCDRRPCLVLHGPAVIDPRWLRREFDELELRYCVRWRPLAGLTSLMGFAWKLVRSAVRALWRRAKAVKPDARHPLTEPSPGNDPRPLPGLLVLQQDDLGTDRSYRTQPHWILPDCCRPAFRTYVLKKSYVPRAPYDTADLAAQGVQVLEGWSALMRMRFNSPVLRTLAWDLTRCSLTSVLRRSNAEGAAMRAVVGLLARAWFLATLCSRFDIRAFLSADHFLVEADAMQLIGPHIGVETVSYQYSNLSRHSTVMMTMADTMLTFSPAFEAIWTLDGIRPKRFIANGYVFDSSFAHLRERAYRQRRALAEAGASFVVCYFDENVSHDRYGLIHPEDHRGEILRLLRMVIEDSTFGLVVKTQYRRNSPSRLLAGDPELKTALSTGRYVELIHGTHRNTVLPAEAALAADLAMGHVFGATASLEAAMAGRRSVMLNSFDVTGAHDHLYGQANIVFASLDHALAAVRDFRAGVPAQANLGDWEPIASQFDAFRDGNAGCRLQRILDEVTNRDAPAEMDGAGGEISSVA